MRTMGFGRRKLKDFTNESKEERKNERGRERGEKGRRNQAVDPYPRGALGPRDSSVIYIRNESEAQSGH